MVIPIDDAEARKRLLAFLRQRGYLATEVESGVSAQPLNPVSDRYDQTALLARVEEWEQLESQPAAGN